MYRVINNYNNINKPIGFIRIRLDIPKLNEIIELSKLRKEGKVYIKNAEGNIILISNDDENSDWERAVINKLSSDEITTSITNDGRSEEHTSELQSRGHLVCRLLLEKKNRISRVTA